MKRLSFVLLTICVISVSGYSYGPRGHHLVGAIADRRLAKNDTVATKVKELLDGMTLERAATLPDEIKGWADCGDNKNKVGAGDSIAAASKRINTELRDFVKANLSAPCHTEFHYTNVPVFGDDKYEDAEVGTREFDIVQMIPFCIRVLKNQEPQPNNRAITKSVAVILLAHYLGDLHQPLHVGAEFFDASGKAFEPSKTNKGFSDQGGNKLTLFTLMNGKPLTAGKFHGYWDGQTVTNAFGSTQNSTVANKLANKEPANWQLTGEVEGWAEQMANEIMPLARNAHGRLKYAAIKIKVGDPEITSGRAEERKKSGGKFYAIWAAENVREEIHKGGWRLAALLEKALQ
jgi:hypothetical protein